MKKKKLSIYLAGGMEKTAEYGAGWRSDITPFLEELGLDVLNPCQFEPQQLQGLRPGRLPEGIAHWHELKNFPEHRARFLRYMRRIIQYDLRLVANDVDLVVVHWDNTTARGAGTHAEVSAAFMNQVPVYIVTDTELPAWIIGCATSDRIFDNMEDLKKALQEDLS